MKNKKLDYDFLVKGSKYETQCEHVYILFIPRSATMIHFYRCSYQLDSFDNFVKNTILNYKPGKNLQDPLFLQQRADVIDMLLFLY